MARIKKYSPEQNLSSFQTFLIDENPNSDYFRITEFKDTFTGGKNGFLIEGSEYLKESTEIKIELLDVAGNPIYFEPGNGIPEYYEGISKLIAVYVYNDTPIGLGKITVLGELKEYDDNGVKREVPNEWKGAYNVKWERTFQINKTLPNEDKVRFYRRPEVTIDEIVKPIFSGNPPVITQTGTLDGIPLVPTDGGNLSNFTLPTSYRLKVNSGNNWTGSIEGETVVFDNISYSPVIDEVINETELIVSPPYSENNIVKSFTNEDYSLEFPYIEGVGDLATALTGSFAKISITDMKTFVGDAARVKVFRRSQSNLTDFEFVQEIQLESNEVLRDITTFAKKEEPYGFFTQPVIDEYWVTSSNDFNVEFNQKFLYNSAKLDSSPDNFFFTSQSFSIQKDVEYTLDFNVRLSGSVDTNDYLKVFLSGSNGGTAVSQPITTINASNGILQKTNINENIIADKFDSSKLYFEVSGSDWYVNNVSLKASQETSFSPDEITFIQQVPKTLVTETFDYRFEFYDINNNFIPIRVEDTKTFVGGNTNLFNKSIEINADNLYFSFDSASNPANPLPPTVINFEVDTNIVTGSINYTSGAFDFFGNEISASEYVGGQYPGLLRNREEQNGRLPFLTVQDFTGSRDDLVVQFIRFTAEVEGVSDSIIITRVEDGKGGVNFEIVPYRGTQIKNKESKTLEVQAVRVDGINRIDLQSGLRSDFSDAKLHILSASLDGATETTTYVSLSQAITDTNFIQGISAGLTGSGEIDYNAIFNRDAIDNELTLYLMDGPTSESILTSLILTDLKDGLNPGLVTSTADQFNIKYKPRETSPFNPLQSIVTASFQRRGTTLNPISASLKVIPSSSIEPKTELPQLFMFYETGAFDDTIGVVVTDYLGNIIGNGVPGITLDETSGNPISFYQGIETKQLNFEFTYTEPITSASVTANKSFFITPDGLPGQDSITIDIDPNPVALGSNHKGEVYDYTLANTNININQGDYFLVNTASGDPGTFTTRSVVPTNIVYGTLDGNSTTTMSLAGFESMSALSASVRYDFDIYPYFTASLITASRTQKFTKVVEGGGAIEVTLDPIAVSFNADESGYISDYSSGKTEVVIKQNDEFFFYDEEDLGTPGTFVTASISASNISFSEISTSFDDLSVSGSVASTGGEVLHFKGYGGMSRTDVSASILYNFKVYPYSLSGGTAGIPRIVSKKQTFSKVNDGSKARKVALISTADTIIYDGDGVKISPQGTVTLTANSFNTTGSAFFKFIDDEGGTIQVSSTDNTVNNLSPLPATGSIRTYTVELRDGNSDGDVLDTDSISIAGIQEGSSAYSVALSNPASSVTVEVDGSTFFDNAGTLIRAYKGGTELQYVEEYNETAVDPITFLPIGTFGQFSASVHEISPFLTQDILRDNKEIVSSSGELFASSSVVTNWNSPQSNTQGFITFKIDFENGRGTQFVQQSFSTVFEGATGPGIVLRGEWTASIPYIFDQGNKRRDAVLRDVSGTTHYWATTQDVPSGSEYTNGDNVYTEVPQLPSGPPYEEGTIDSNGWEYLGEQELFVAAKIAIFDESFVKNTINVGQPTTDYDTNPQIAIVGGTDEPYISIGQDIQGYGQQGAYIGVTEDGGPGGEVGGLLSLSGDPTDANHKSLRWDGANLLIRGAIRQTAAGAVEPQLRGDWSQPTNYNALDSVIHIGQSWSANTAHTSSAAGNSGPPGTGIYWDSSSGTGKTVSLAASTFVIEFDQDGNNPSPSSINVFASSSNFLDPYFKFTGGSTFFTDETSFTDGSDDDNDIVSSIDISTATMASMPLQFRVAVSEGDQVEVVSDVINVFGVKPGSDTAPNFFITPIAGGTQIKNSSGTITLQVQKADINGITNITGQSGTDPEIFSGSTVLSNTMVGITNGSSPAAQNPIISAAAIDGTKTLLLKDSNGTVLDSITLLDVTDGLGGGSFQAPSLKINRNTSVTPNTYTASFLEPTASFYDTSGQEYQKRVRITPSFSNGVDNMSLGPASGDSEISFTATDGDGTNMFFGVGQTEPTKDVVITAVFTDPATGQQNTINETFYIVSDGVDGIDAITVINTNQAHSLPASSAGVVSSYANSGTNIRVFEGVNELTYDGTGTSDGTWKVQASISPSNIPPYINVGTITDNGDDVIVDNHSSMDNNEDIVTITYTITGTRSGGASFTSTTTQTLTKVKDGTDGVDGDASGIVYAGVWEVGTNNTYDNPTEYLSGDLKYVVKYNDGSGDTFYTTEVEHFHRGTFVQNTQDYAINDIVLHLGTYWRANQSITGQSRSTEPSDQGQTMWDSLGAASNLVPGTLQAYDGGTLTSAFAEFGAQFTSVATDILFAEDVYANKTINIGTGENNKPVISLNADTDNGSASPFISIGQVTQSFESDGIFLGFPSESASPVMSLVSGSSYMIYNDGTVALSNAAIQGTGSNSSIVGPTLSVGRNTDHPEQHPLGYNFSVGSEGIMSASQAFIRGTINATGGSIGQWVITEQNAEETLLPADIGVLQDSDGELRFNPTKAEIQIFSGSVVDTTTILNPPAELGNSLGQTFAYIATASVAVVNSATYGGNVFTINTGDGNGVVEKPLLSMKRSKYSPIKLNQVAPFDIQGGYYFDMSDSTNSGHKLNFTFDALDAASRTPFFETQTTSTTTSTGQPFLIQSSSVAPGNPGAYIQLTLSESVTQSNTMYYYCENHPTTMGNEITLYDHDANTEEEIRDYTERVVIGAQDQFTSAQGTNSTFEWSTSGGSPYTANQGWDDYTFANSGSAGSFGNYPDTVYYYDEAGESDATNQPVSLPAGDVKITGIRAPKLHVNSSGINTAEYTSNTPNYNPSYANQIHGSMGLSAFPVRGNRTIRYELLIQEDNGDGTYTTVSTRYISQKTAYGAADQYGYWVSVSTGGGGGYYSVVSNTKITLEDGTTKLAKDITLDDKILSWDSKKEKWVSAKLSNIYKKNVAEVYRVSVGGKEVEVSGNHKFWLDGGEGNSCAVSVSTLHKEYMVGLPLTQDNLRLWVKDGDSKKKCIVDKIQKINKNEEVITFTVPKYVNYISNDIISHNYITQNYYWEFEVLSSAQNATGNTYADSVSGVTHNVTIPSAGNYVARYRVRLSSSAVGSVTVGTSSSATATFSYDSFSSYWNYNYTSANFYLSNGSTNPSEPYQTLTIESENNFIEILPAGIQVVSATNRYTRLNRKEASGNGDGLIEVVNGSIIIDSEDNVGSAQNSGEVAIDARGDIIPKDTLEWTLGTSARKWMELNGFDISLFEVDTGTTGHIRLLDGIKIQWGSFSSSDDAAQTVTFGDAFTDSAYVVIPSLPGRVMSISLTNFSFDRLNAVDGTETLYYVAIGKDTS